MRTFTDSDINAQVMIFDGVSELIEKTVDAALSRHEPLREASFLGRSIPRGWEGVKEAFFSTPAREWEMFQKVHNAVKDEVVNVSTRSVRRKLHWSDADGEIDLDRALGGEPEFYGEHRRTRTMAPAPVTVLCNFNGNSWLSPKDIFMSGAAAVTLIDMVEDAGFPCEVWMYSNNREAYYGPCSTHFACYRFKEAGDPLDPISMVNALSSWFWRSVGLRSMHLSGRRVSSGYGCSTPTLTNRERFMEVTPGQRVIRMPNVGSLKDEDQVAAFIRTALTSLEEVPTMS